MKFPMSRRCPIDITYSKSNEPRVSPRSSTVNPGFHSVPGTAEGGGTLLAALINASSRSRKLMLSQHLIDSLFSPDLPEPEHWERRYPPRDLPEGAEVTRFSPSPTGFLHIGGVYVATIDVDVARHSGGRYLVRLEDTDQARVTEGAAEQFAEAFAYFSIGPDEDDETGRYGPYFQSGRAGTYLTYVRELLRRGHAYPCFATKQDLEEITARQRATGALPGYYGTWAIWRDAPEEQVAARLAAGDPYGARVRSPGAAGAAAGAEVTSKAEAGGGLPRTTPPKAR